MDSSSPGDVNRTILGFLEREILSTGCVCKVNLKALIFWMVKVLQEGEDSQRLQIVSWINEWTRALYGKSAGVSVCQGLFRVVSLFRQQKFHLLLALEKISLQPGSDEHLRYACRKTFLTLMKLLPCGSHSACQKSCQLFLRRVIMRRLRGPDGALAIPDVLNEFFDSVPLGTSMRLRPDTCPRPCHRTIEQNSWHEDELKHHLVQNLNSDWKRLSQLLIQSSDPRSAHTFFNLWKKLVSIRSNLGVSVSRDIISSTSLLVPELICPKPCLIWRKQVDVLNEVLCYGSTLALQNDVPPDVSGIAQGLVKAALTSKFFARHAKLPLTSKGFLGSRESCLLEDQGPESDLFLNKQLLQGFSLILLKSTAVIIREASSCSSSDDSDTSNSSRGSVCQEDVRIIDQNVTCLLQSLQDWVNGLMAFHPNQSCTDTFVQLFFDQDDYVIEAMLCLLDIHNGLESLSVAINLEFEPISIFEAFMVKCSWDSSILVDFLVSNETCFLLYLLRLLKYISKKTLKSLSHPLRECFVSLEDSLKKLVTSSLFPYNIDPILTLIQKIIKG